MTKRLDLLDIQGNVIRAYGRFGYPVARYVFFNIRQSDVARDFLKELSKHVTTAIDWGNGEGQIKQPNWTVNVAFTYVGLKELGLPRTSLNGFSPEFIAGMKKRRDIIGDNGPSSPEHWDPIWHKHREEKESDIHIFISLNARLPVYLEESYTWLNNLVARYSKGVVLLSGHRGDDGKIVDYQDGKVVIENGHVTSKEHFGYTDGIGDPVFEGTPNYDLKVHGRGKQMEDGSWAPLATGEFLLGHIDEAKEYPPAPEPVQLARNGTYMVYRKLHENVATFDAYLEEHGKKYPGGKELLAAKFVGRWRDNGAPLTKAPTAESKQKFDMAFNVANIDEKDKLLSDFTYDEDMSGAKCPFSAHIRRINPRASLQMVKGDKPGCMVMNNGAFDTPGALANRRRLLRRGLPYGEAKDRTRNDGNHGIIIMMINADINRQFEFVQQQWINYGNDFQSASEKEILLGNHSDDPQFPSKAVLQVEPDSQEAPYFLSKIPRLVETRGGDYFFIPSLTALRMIAKGVIDPT
jgi:Dyp-type peroxidase family